MAVIVKTLEKVQPSGAVYSRVHIHVYVHEASFTYMYMYTHVHGTSMQV